MLREIVEELQSQDEVIGNRDQKAKKLAKKTAKAKGKVKCTGNKTPEKVPTSGGVIKFKCTPKDMEKARKMSKIRKKFNKSAAGKIAQKVSQKTKEFRK